MVLSKLVRDKIPKIILNSGRIPVYRQEPRLVQKFALVEAKILEEVEELFAVETTEGLIEELADVYEILNTYVELSGISHKDISIKMFEKGTKNGVFNDFIVLENV
jgi:predicted house-cleaning noncanonical NTP pyrophosphatase (MazG superfamily)